MALKGSSSKEYITNKILEMFENSFQYDKEIRIPILENGEEIQIKCTLTCAKTNVEKNGDIKIPGANDNNDNEINFIDNNTTSVEISTEEKNNIQRLAAMLDL